ncbi:MAG: GDP-mannose-dependent alpha-mannosyltransferase [Microgenomates bacterium OLB22]|nr:MAG: GDP-mannose-dependent alpha-mannosyltransferase [Microgenomates bacterium OLB22]
MKIAIFTDAFYPQVNGVVTHVVEVSNHLAKKHTVCIVAAKPEKLPDASFGLSSQVLLQYVKSYALSLYPDFRVTNPYRQELTQFFKEFDPDVVHFHTPWTVAYAGVRAAVKANKPIVGTFHTYFLDPEYLKIIKMDALFIVNNHLVMKMLWKFLMGIYHQSDAIIALTSNVRRELLRHETERPVHLIPTGINTKEFMQKPKLPCPFKKPYILCLGRTSVEKSLDVVIESFARIASMVPHDLVIVGDGPARADLQARAIELGLGDRVVFPGSIKRTDVIKMGIYSHADLYISASKTETLGLTFLEALASGIPVIGVAKNGAKEVLRDTGVLCPPDDRDAMAKEIYKILSGDTSSFHSEAVKTLLDRFDTEASIEKLEELYTKVIDQKAKEQVV